MITSLLRPLQRKHLFLRKGISIIMSQQQKGFSAACCIIGDEILNGKTRDSNAYFLCKKYFDMYKYQLLLTTFLLLKLNIYLNSALT